MLCMQSQESQPLISRDVQKGPDLVFCEVISFLTKVAASLVGIAQIVSIGAAEYCSLALNKSAGLRV